MAKEIAGPAEVYKAVREGKPLPGGWTINYGHTPNIMTIEEREEFDKTGSIPASASRRAAAERKAFGLPPADGDDDEVDMADADAATAATASDTMQSRTDAVTSDTSVSRSRGSNRTT